MSKSARDHASHTTVTYSRDDVLERARRLAERQGAEAVTLRRLAEELRTSRPQMARMFPDDHDLLFGLLDVVAAEMVPPSGVEDPRERLVAALGHVRAVLQRNRWVIPILASGQLLGPGALALTEYVIQALLDAGLDEEAAGVGQATLWRFTIGSLAVENPSVVDGVAAARTVAAADPARYPALTRSLPAFSKVLPDDVFARGVTAFVDGLLSTSG